MEKVSAVFMSRRLNEIIEIHKENLRKDGFFLPSFHFFNAGKPLRLDTTSFKAHVFSYGDTSGCDEGHIYHTALYFEVFDIEDFTRMQKIADKLVHTHYPDATASVLPCIFRTKKDAELIANEKFYDRKEKLRKQTGITAIYACIFSSGQNDCITKLVPYEDFDKNSDVNLSCHGNSDSVLKRLCGKMPEANSVNDIILEPHYLGALLLYKERESHRVGYSDLPWTSNIMPMEPQLENPYRVEAVSTLLPDNWTEICIINVYHEKEVFSFCETKRKRTGCMIREIDRMFDFCKMDVIKRSSLHLLKRGAKGILITDGTDGKSVTLYPEKNRKRFSREEFSALVHKKTVTEIKKLLGKPSHTAEDLQLQTEIFYSFEKYMGDTWAIDNPYDFVVYNAYTKRDDYVVIITINSKTRRAEQITFIDR